MVPRRLTGIVCEVLLCLAWIHDRGAQLHHYIPYYNRRLCRPAQRPAWRWYLVSVEALHLTVCPPAWNRLCIGGLCGCCIVCAGVGQISGNAAVKPCKRFWRCVCINCKGERKTVVNACERLTRRRAKTKALHQSMQGKRKTPPAWAGAGLLYGAAPLKYPGGVTSTP